MLCTSASCNASSTRISVVTERLGSMVGITITMTGNAKADGKLCS